VFGPVGEENDWVGRLLSDMGFSPNRGSILGFCDTVKMSKAIDQLLALIGWRESGRSFGMDQERPCNLRRDARGGSAAGEGQECSGCPAWESAAARGKEDPRRAGERVGSLNWQNTRGSRLSPHT